MPALPLDVHRVEDLLDHVALLDRVRELQHAVGERRLAVVDVRDDREVADESRGPSWLVMIAGGRAVAREGARFVHGRRTATRATVRLEAATRPVLPSRGSSAAPLRRFVHQPVSRKDRPDVANIKSQKKRVLTNAKAHEREQVGALAREDRGQEGQRGHRRRRQGRGAGRTRGGELASSTAPRARASSTRTRPRTARAASRAPSRRWRSGPRLSPDPDPARRSSARSSAPARARHPSGSSSSPPRPPPAPATPRRARRA